MINLNSSVNIYLPFVKIYFDDINEVLEILKELKPSGIELQTGEKSFSIDEIKLIADKRINNFKIIAHYVEEWYDIKISFDNFNNKIYCHRQTNEIFGVCKKVEDYFKKKSRFFNFAVKNYRSASLLGILIVIDLIIFFIIFQNQNQPLIFIVFSFFISILSFFVFYLTKFYRNIIILKNKKNCDNWFRRNKDQILVQLMVGTLLLFFGYFLGVNSK